MTQGTFCTNCGAALGLGVRFCDNCGQPVGISTPAPARPSMPASPPQRRRFPWWTLILGVGCLGILCLGVMVAGGLAFFSDLNIVLPALPAPTDPAAPVPAPTLPLQPVQPTNLPTPTLIPSSTVAPTESGAVLTGDQRLDNHSLYDDFSSEALSWPVFDDGKTILKYENQAYSFQITEPDFYDWAFIPVDFTPYEIRFDVQGPAGQQDGTFGVFCQFQDADNYYYAEFDLQNHSYILAQILNGEDIPLTKQDSAGQYWQDTSAFQLSPTSVNHIGISCYLNVITLFINDQWVNEVNVLQPFDQPSEAALFVYTFDFAGENGYRVFFDNVEAWQPVQ